MSNYLLWLRRLLILSFALVMLFIIMAQTGNESQSSPEQPIPAGLSHYLDSLRKTDNLEEWLARSIEYLEDKPAERIHFLYTAEATAWRLPRNDAERLAWFDLLTNQGYYELFRGNILRSIQAYEKAYRYYFDKPIPGAAPDVVEYVLKPLGNNYTRLGDYDRAFFIHEKTLNLSLEQKNMSQAAAAYNNLAISARWRGGLDSAQRYVMYGLNAVEKNSPLHGLLLSTSADIFFLSNQFAKAEATVKEAIRILKGNISNKEGDSPYWLLSAYQVHGNILKEKGDLQAAIQNYEKGKKLVDDYFKGQRKRENAKLCVSAGNAFLKMQQPLKAIEEFNFALRILLPSFPLTTADELPAVTELYAENTILDALQGKAAGLLALGKKEKALDCFLLLFTVERRLRYEFFSPSSKRQQQKENRQWVESAIETAYQLWKVSGQKEYADKILLIAEMSKAQLLLDEMTSNLQYNRIKNEDTLLARQQRIMQVINFYERETMLNTAAGRKDSSMVAAKNELQYELSLIQKRVKEKYPALTGYMMPEQLLSADSLLNNIPARTTVIEFFSGEKNIYRILAKKDRVEQVHKLENAAKLQQVMKDFVFTWFQQGPEKMMNEPRRYYKDAYQVYHWLWDVQAAHEQDRFIVIPDGVIGYIPFDALLTDSVYKANIDLWPFLVKKANLFFGYSLQTWQQQQRIQYPNELSSGFFISFDSSTNAAIPAVKKEYTSLKRLVNGKFFTEKDASLKTFQNQLDKVNLLHISTHSFLQGKENIPVLQLADDKFFLFELSGRSFHPQLVVLSACRTGHGMLAEGEGIISLARGFIATGAGGIVAGLWNMNDESTAALMGNFYSHLVKSKRPADALYAAKNEWLKQSHGQILNKLPFFWAGLIYVGNNQPVVLAKKNSPRPVAWMIATVLIALLLGYPFLKWRKKRLKRELLARAHQEFTNNTPD